MSRQLTERDVRAHLGFVEMGDYVGQELDRLLAKGYDIVSAKDGDEFVVYGINTFANEIVTERRNAFLIEAIAHVVLDMSIAPLRAEDV